MAFINYELMNYEPQIIHIRPRVRPRAVLDCWWLSLEVIHIFCYLPPWPFSCIFAANPACHCKHSWSRLIHPSCSFSARLAVPRPGLLSWRLVVHIFYDRSAITLLSFTIIPLHINWLVRDMVLLTGSRGCFSIMRQFLYLYFVLLYVFSKTIDLLCMAM